MKSVVTHASFFAAALLLACFAALALTPTQAKILSQWVQLGPDGAVSARAVTDEACPVVTFDGTRVTMRVRAEPGQTFGNVSAAEFPVRSCEADVPAGTHAATLDGKFLPLPQSNPRRIVIFGDTGCRLLGNAAQNCNDPNDWPFAKIARLAALAQPDLVIHVGDYHYRENACPVARAGCAGSPFGYGWDAWNADFFEPAAPLLASAPWVLTRGNHEDCNRAGEGWFRFLDRLPMEHACRDLTGVFVARQGDFGLVVVDGANAPDPRGDASSLVALLRSQLAAVAGRVPAEAWLVSHRPLNAMEVSFGGNRTVVDNAVQEAAFGPVMPAGVRMHVAGHVHFFQAVDFGGMRPPTLVVGTGGDALVTMSPMSVVGSDLNGMQVVNSVTRLGFGYMVLEREGAVGTGEWLGTLYDVEGHALDHCRLVARSLICGR